MSITDRNENLVTRIGYRGHELQAQKKTFELCLINDLLVSTRYHPQLSSAQTIP